MNTDLIDKLGAKPIEPQLAVINGLTDKKKIAQLDLAMQKFGGGGMFGVSVGQDQVDSSKQILQAGAGGGGGRGGGGGLGLPDRDYYLDTDARSVKIREQYLAHVTAMFTLLDGNGAKAAAEAADVMRIETALAKATLTRAEGRDPAARYHIMTVDKLQAMTPDFDWNVLLNGEGVGQVKTLNVTAPKLMTAMNAEIEAEPLSALQTYMKWHVLHGAAANLAKPFAQENFNFFSATLSGQKEEQPRWKTCTRMTDGALGQAVGQDWVKENFPPEAKENMAKLVKALEKALDEDIKALPWMSDATKAEAEKKLMAFRDKIGYPDKWLDYSKFTVSRDDLVGNLHQEAIFQRNRNMEKLGKPVDEREMGMTPPTVNASYSPQMNDITFPAGILQPPFYDNTKDLAVNYGAIGVVIGHEMTHGFDDEGSQYGPSGNVKYNADGSKGSWFTPEDLTKFNERTKCISDEYSGFTVAEGQNLNGKQTLGENSADNGGIHVAFQALQEVLAAQGMSPDTKIDGYTENQRFFIAFGQVWCENTREQQARRAAKTDVHSNGKWRTDGTVQNIDEFGKAFGCKVGQPMMPEKSCRVW